ncbi:ankyrin repeat domain-containing protein [Cardinium endosymbiont of Culicoides punctatus]|uniref:ankyrin repeat domain-containing protein n=1 Tax=Cardinium endosymbiont of Culicoides punctatus TaxID=2304601 RepID=UPI0010591CE5|nr:ankyrin repeat domain-containing protein [Cardinium endosymbiont of Culicoides punctatus]TDG95176.1 hypothetical protein CCPUN_05970 [Cardinium endosymbiont of Culicoides punctatus]
MRQNRKFRIIINRCTQIYLLLIFLASNCKQNTEHTLIHTKKTRAHAYPDENIINAQSIIEQQNSSAHNVYDAKTQAITLQQNTPSQNSSKKQHYASIPTLVENDEESHNNNKKNEWTPFLVCTFIAKCKKNVFVKYNFNDEEWDSPKRRFRGVVYACLFILEPRKTEPKYSFHEGVQMNKIQLVQLLLYRGYDINAKDINDMTGLHYAVTCNRTEMVEILLHFGATVDVLNEEGHTPLHCAIIWKRKEIIQKLLSHGASITQLDNQDLTPLDYVTTPCLGKEQEIMEILLNSSEGNKPDNAT